MIRVPFKPLLPLLFYLLAWCGPAAAGDQVPLSRGQTVYVAIYSHVFSGDKGLPFNLATMLSIRNTDPLQSMTLVTASYYDNDGKLLKKHLDQPLVIGPLASKHFFLKESDETGGFGAKFIVQWEGERDMNVPIIESIMIGARSGQGISFRCPGQVIQERSR